MYECPRLKSLPLPDQGMHSFQKLHISNCRVLKLLSESESQGMIPYLLSLQLLIIKNCSEKLRGRTRGWGKESEEWPPNIKHIPDIKLGPLGTQEIALWWGVKDQLSMLMSTVTRIKGVLQDAEEQVQKPPAQLEDWLGKLQEAVYDAEDLLDDFSTEVQRKRLMSRNKIPREVRTFFSGSNQLVYGWQMGHKVKELRQRLDEIVSESEKFHFEAFGTGQESNYIDEKIKKEIVERCQGVPLVIKAIASAQRLRTLVLLKGGKWDEGSWESICRDFRLLRVLVSSHLGMKEVSPLIEKLKHLKYLDLSNNKMEALPNSVTSLVNLQVLKLNDCSNLKELPRGIDKLINLRHLDVGCYRDGDLCKKLEYMPRGIEKLTSLQTLTCFVVAKKSTKSEMIGGLDELSRLNELRGRLEIRVKGYEGGSCISEFKGAKLIDKEYLQSLTVRWDRELDSDSDIDLYDKMLQSLQPNSSLQELRIEGYGGMRFPSWVSDLSNLVRIRLEWCRRLKHIPPLHGIPYLEELSIMGLDDLEYIDSEGVGGKGVPMFFPSLKRLYIESCFRLKGWWKRWSRDEMNDDSDESTIEEGLIMLSFPRLSSLSIGVCPNLTSMPLFPTLDEDLYLDGTSSMPLQQTMKMTSPVSSSSFFRPLSKLKSLYMHSIDDMESLPEVGLQNLSSLQWLSIMACSRLKSLPLPDQGMHSLQKLEFTFCQELKSLSESESQGTIPYLPSLQELIIIGCSGRTTRWGKKREEEWPNIKHIPYIEIGLRILDAAIDISYIFTGCNSGNIEAVSRASNSEDEKTVWRVADIINLKFLL
ncbi:disease resistance protein RGA4 [Populus alba x Populus x berolinensis]|uniref:Disease resistance protein RGA4 n=1 Tax=Populus alba x Populus x berolinensis TaxID=444605 RepID=A0AAD6QRI8_9ROSI|nr:disease resistance protein RGA4 [Populus alba x Populus x berolinensis]